MNNKTYTIYIVICFAVFCAGVFGVYETIRRIAIERNRVVELSQEIVNDSLLQQQTIEVKKQIEGLTEQVQSMDAYVIDADKDVEFIDRVQVTGKQFGLETTISSVDTKQFTNKAGLEYLTMRIKTRGDWSRVWSFLRYIENLPYGLSIDTVDISFVTLQEKPKTESIWEGTFDIKVLKKKQ